MNIVLVVNLFPPKWVAGTEIATYQIAEHLAKRGHTVSVITSLDDNQTENSYEKGFFIHRTPMIRIRFLREFFFWINIFKIINKIDPDIIHIQSLIFATPAFLSKKLLKIPYVVWGQGSDVYIQNWLTRLLSKVIIKNADCVIALTKDMKMVMQNIYYRDIVVIPNAIKIEEFPDRLFEKETDSYDKRILFVGRLDPVKGLKTLLKSMEIVCEKVPDTKLILVGDGEERENLEFLTNSLGIKDKVQFVGRIPHKNISDYMHQADILVLPSLSEGLPIVILEGMASGLPIVATRVGGLPEIIEDGVNGYLVESGDFQEMAKKIIFILENQPLKSLFSKNNRIKVQAYDWKIVISQLENIYVKIINQQH
jgi:glycosyltransferase involved in cell wall biosynthesis